MFKSLRVVLAFTLAAVALPLLSSLDAGATSGAPQCVVSLSPTATETLFAIGAGKEVQAVDTDSDFPKNLPSKRIKALDPSVESVIGICKPTASHPSAKPNLVIISYDANDIQQKLTNFGVKVLLQEPPTTLQGAYRQIDQLGTLTGHQRSAAAVVTRLKATVAADVASIPAHATKTLTAYYELDPTYYSLASNTFVGSLMKSLGVVNIADAKSTSADAGYPQLSAEYVVSANPKLIFLADTICCHVSGSSLAKRTGWSSITAVKDHQVVGLNDDIASRWGPRLGILMNDLAAGVKSALADAALWKR